MEPEKSADSEPSVCSGPLTQAGIMEKYERLEKKFGGPSAVRRALRRAVRHFEEKKKGLEEKEKERPRQGQQRQKAE